MSLSIVLSAVMMLLLSTSFKASAQDRATDLSNRATQLAAQGRFAEALPIAGEAVTEAASRYGKQSLPYGSGLAGLGYLQMMTNDFKDAETSMTQGFEIIRTAVGDSSLQLAPTMANMAQVYMSEANAQSGIPAQTMPLLQKSEVWSRKLLALGEKNYPAEDPNLVNPLERLCFVLSAEQKYAEVRPLLQRSLALEMAALPADHVQTIRTRNELGWTLNQLGDRDGAIDQYRKALASAEKTLGANDPVTTGVRDALRQLEAGSGNLSAPLPSSGAAGNDLVTAMLASLHQATTACSSSFRTYREGKAELQDGDRSYSAPKLPGATSCDIWQYKDKDLGSRYSCVLGEGLPADLSQQMFGSLRNSLLASFADWKPHDSVIGSSTHFRLTSKSDENCGIVLELLTTRRGGTVIVAVDGR